MVLLQQTQLVKTGIRPLNCDDCDKAFKTNWNFKRHQDIFKVFRSCCIGFCDKKLIQSTILKQTQYYLTHTVKQPPCEL